MVLADADEETVTMIVKTTKMKVRTAIMDLDIRSPRSLFKHKSYRESSFGVASYLLKALLLGVLIFTLVSLFPLLSKADDSKKWWEWDTATGNWGGARQTMADHGVNFEFFYTADFLGVATGGIQHKMTYLHLVDLNLNLDMDKLVGWKGASFHFSGEASQGESPSNHAGDLQTLSNIDAPDFWKLYLAYLQQDFLDGKLSLLAGLMDSNADFDSGVVDAFFIHSTPGMGPEFSGSGLNGPALWPYSAVGALAKIKLYKGLYINIAAYDGVAGNPATPNSNPIKFSKADGALIVSELGWESKDIDDDKAADKAYRKLSLGSWVYTSSFDDVLDVDLAGNPTHHKTNYGIYAYIESQLLREKEDKTQGLSGFARFGMANKDFNQVAYSSMVGLVYTGPIKGRNSDQVGLLVAAAHNGSKYRSAQVAAGTPVKKSEVALEASYRAQITPWMAVQPDVQYIINPGTDPTLKNALVAGARIEVSF